MQTLTTPSTGDYGIDALLGPQRWALGSITYSFPTASSRWSTGPGEYLAASSEPFTSFVALSAAQRESVASALNAWASVARLNFTLLSDDTTNPGTLRFGWSTLNASLQADSYPPATTDKAGDIWLNTAATWNGFAKGGYGYSTLLHEIGHALGLKDTAAGPRTMPTAEDGYSASLMSANAVAGWAGSWVDFEPTTPMPYDIAAIQQLYGANTSFHADDDVYVYRPGQNYFETIWDAGGFDIIQWESDSQGAVIDLREGAFSQLGKPLTYWTEDYSQSRTDPRTVAIAYGAIVEMAVGGDGNDELIANGWGSILMGRGGNDTLRGWGNLDAAFYETARSAATTDRLASGAIQITSAEGTDTLIGVERALFSDTAMAFDIDGLGGQAYRLYRAAFDRPPDTEGLGFWMYHLDRGFNFVDAANNFLNSTEFRAMYGENPTNAEYVRLLYVHVNHREPDAGGNQFWLDAMANANGGFGHAWTKGEILLQFSESAENKANVIGVIEDGFNYTPFLG